MSKYKAITVYCGSSYGNKSIYQEQASDLGKLMAQRGIGLVYGGGEIGLMGKVSGAVRENGGKVTGIIPHFFLDKCHPESKGLEGEVGVEGKHQYEIITVDSMHTRKLMMSEKCDAIIALPGGIGTMEELVEALTWSHVGLHYKPIGLLNTEGYYDTFLTLLNQFVDSGFLPNSGMDLFVVGKTPEELLNKLESHQPPRGFLDK